MKTPKAPGAKDAARTDKERAFPLVGDALQQDNARAKAKSMGKDKVASPAKQMRPGKGYK
jgi:hypothetical protein